MAGAFDEPPYPALTAADFGPARPYRVETRHGGRMVVIGDRSDPGLRRTPNLVGPGPAEVDVVIHGFPGRFIEQANGSREIPAPLLAALIEATGIPRGTPLRLLTCHAAEAPAHGPTAAQQLATEWGGPVTGPDGLLRVLAGSFSVDVVEWRDDPFGGMAPDIIGAGQGGWATSHP